MEQLSAQDLQFRIVREVAKIECEADELWRTCKPLEERHAEINRAIEVKQQEIKGFIEEHLEKGTISRHTDELESMQMYIVREKQLQKEVVDEMMSIKEKVGALRRQAHENLTKIFEDVVSGMYGRGEFYFHGKKIMRVIGGIPGKKDNIGGAVMLLQVPIIDGQERKNMVEYCETGESVLINISTKVMPITKEDAEIICAEIPEYNLLRNAIPEFMVWTPYQSVYRIPYREQSVKKSHIYLVCLPDEMIACAMVEETVFPKLKISFIGACKRDYDILDVLNYWPGIPGKDVELQELRKDDEKLAANILCRALTNERIGCIIEL